MDKICKKCKRTFKSNIMKNGKRMNFSNRKYCLECSPYKGHNTAKLDKIKSFEKLCPKCGIIKSLSFFSIRKDKRPAAYCKECTTIVSREHRLNMKKKMIEYLGGKCNKCNYSKCNDALEFHHKNPSNKGFNISNYGNKSFKNLKDELDKCILLCANCHRELHNKNNSSN